MLYVTGITGHTGRWFLDKLINEKYVGEIRCLIREGSNTEAAIKNNVRWSILVHTTGRYSKYKSASQEYIEIEDRLLVKRDQIGISILRPTMIYGSSNDRNMYRLVSCLYKRKFFPLFGNGENLMQPVYAMDLGNAYYDVILNRSVTFNNEYNLSGKDPIKYIDLVKCVSDNLGRKNVIVKVPLWISISAAKIYNKLTNKAIISVEQVLRMQEDKAFSYDAAANDFNYNPVSFEKGIENEIVEFVNSQAKRKMR